MKSVDTQRKLAESLGRLRRKRHMHPAKLSKSVRESSSIKFCRYLIVCLGVNSLERKIVERLRFASDSYQGKSVTFKETD
jgi:hypothetical protein